MTIETVAGTHNFVFNNEDNGGESLSLKTLFIANGDPGEVWTQQTLMLHSYCNSVQLNLFTALFTPERLRKLADELEAAEKSAIEAAR